MPWSGGQRRRGPRVAVTLDVALTRGHGNPVSARTLDLGDDGMRVVCTRPLAVDELLRFDLVLPPPEPRVDGQVRVVRQHAGHVYALRVERLDEPSAELLAEFVARPS